MIYSFRLQNYEKMTIFTNEFYPNINIKCNIWVKLNNKGLKDMPKSID